MTNSRQTCSHVQAGWRRTALRFARPFAAAASFGILVLTLPTVAAQTPAVPETKPFILGETVTFFSKVLGEERQIHVYTHPAYGEDESRYPVAYVLDGEWNFRHTSGVIDLLSSREVIPWMIVVGIPNVDRDKDLSPSPIKERPRGGGASLFRRFLREEVFPLVESRYRTEPFRLLVGHSLSGLFAVDAFLAEPDLFQAALALSPYLIWDEDRYLEGALSRKAPRPGRRTFLSVFQGDEPSLRPAFDRLEKQLAKSNDPGLRRTFRVLPDCDHETIYLRGTVQGLLDIFPDWRLPQAAAAAGLEGIRGHYAGLTARYGYEIKPVYFVVVMIGYEFLGRDEVDEAVRILNYAVGLNPGLPYAYEGLGASYRKKGQVEEAVRCYEKALKLAPGDGGIRQALEELKKK